MSTLIKWRRGCREPLFIRVRAAGTLPPYHAGRGLGQNWPLPELNAANAPLHVAEGAMSALVGVYEEYVDRYLVSHDYEVPPRRWLHDHVPADPGVLEFVFPLIEGDAAPFATEVLLVRLVWLIQQCPGLVAYTSPEETVVNTSVGRVGVQGARVLYRFSQDPVVLQAPVDITQALRVGSIRVFNNAMNRLYAALDADGRVALTRLALVIRTKPLLRRLYDDGLVTGSHLSYLRSLDDKILSIEGALKRSDDPATTLMQILVPECLSMKEFRTMFRVPWSRDDRRTLSSDYLIRKMPLVRQLLANNSN